jgi:hypothetical protein
VTAQPAGVALAVCEVAVPRMALSVMWSATGSLLPGLLAAARRGAPARLAATGRGLA